MPGEFDLIDRIRARAGRRPDVVLGIGDDAAVLRVPPGGEEAPAAKKAAPRIRTLSPEQIAEAKGMVIRETASAIVLNKPPGLATQGGSKTTKHVDGLLDAFVETEKTPRPRLVHRLDKDTSGVMVAAKTDKAMRHLAAQFADHGRTGPLHRAYLAWAWGRTQQGRGSVDAPLGRDNHNRLKQAVRRDGREAITHYAVEQRFGDAFAVEDAGGHGAPGTVGAAPRGRVRVAKCDYPRTLPCPATGK